jgi:hypothetical protein
MVLSDKAKSTLPAGDTFWWLWCVVRDQTLLLELFPANGFLVLGPHLVCFELKSKVALDALIPILSTGLPRRERYSYT